MDTTLNIGQFRQLAEARLSTIEGLAIEAGVEPDEILVRTPGQDDEEWVLSVSNPYQKYRESPERCDDLLTTLVTTFQGMTGPEARLVLSDSWGDVSSRIRLQVGWPLNTKRLIGRLVERRGPSGQTGEKGDFGPKPVVPGALAVTCPRRPWHYGLGVTPVIDFPTWIYRVTMDDVARWGVDEDVVFRAGEHGLRDYAASIGTPAIIEVPGVVRVRVWADDSGYAASLALLPDVLRAWWPEWPRMVPLGISIPHRDVIVTCAPLTPDPVPYIVALIGLIAHLDSAAYPLLNPGSNAFRLLRLDEHEVTTF